MEIEISDDDFEDANDNFGLDEFEQDVAVAKGPEPLSMHIFVSLCHFMYFSTRTYNLP